MVSEETEDDSVMARPRASSSLEPFLFLLSEGDRPQAGSLRCSLREIDEIVIGRGNARSIEKNGRSLRLNVPGKTMSSVHARIVKSHGAFVVEDARSRNGVFVNGARVERSAVGPDDVLELGRTTILLRSLPAPPGVADLDTEAASFVPGLSTLRPDLAERFAALARIATSSVPVLVLGETGVGKELLARATHTLSNRKGRFVAVNCGAIPQNLVESQLFGHQKGAFSGAVRDEPGLVRASDGGTLFLDEIGDLPLASQAALLRLLQEREVMPVGSTRAVKVDLRVIAATHRNLRAEVARGTFRDDLLARLSGFVIELPALRARKEDLGVLVAEILSTAEKSGPITVAPAVLRAFLGHDWPHNVRELARVLTTAIALAEDGAIGLAHLPESLDAGDRGERDSSSRAQQSVELEGDLLQAALVGHLRTEKGNVAAVARAMGKAPMQVHRWMKRFGIDPERYR